MSMQIFDSSKSMIYFQHKNNIDTVWFESVNKLESSEFKYSIEERSDTILGKICNKLIVEKKGVILEYYYSSDYYLNPEFYKMYTNGHKDKVMEIMKSFYLKMRIISKDFTMDLLAKNVKEKKMEKEDFKVPTYDKMIKFEY